jgi:hypothetical protein
MAAPSTALQIAIRENTVARHLFVRLQHEQGDVLAWDGLGDFVLNGQTYTGVQGLIGIEGISESYDVQEPGLTITLKRGPAVCYHRDDAKRSRRCADDHSGMAGH